MSLGYGKAQTNILTIIFIITMMVMLVTPVIFVLADENSDWPNALTLVVEVAVGVLIAIIVYIHSNAQHHANRELSGRMTGILKELERSNMAERRLVSRALVLRLGDVIRSLEYVLQQDDRYNIASPEEREKILAQQQRQTKDLTSQSNLGIHYHELARIFDEEAVEMYRDLQIQLQEIPISFSDIEYYNANRADNIEFWKTCINHCKMLMDYVEQHVKDHDTVSNTGFF